MDEEPRLIPFIEVQAWRCPDCKLWHYHHPTPGDPNDPEVRAAADAMGVDLSEGQMEACPIFVFCQKCEGKFELDYGDEDEDDSSG